MSPCCLLATPKPWHSHMPQRLTEATGVLFHLCDDPKKLTLEFIDSLRPRYIFFPHWSFIIPKEIWGKYECVIFHMTDLPFGRGGSPLQNLISRGFSHTKLTALQCVATIDAGPIYLQSELSLKGTAQDIFYRCVPLMEEMIVQMLSQQIIPTPQVGKKTLFARRTPEQSNIDSLSDLTSIYDHIRMLDAEGYPPAFLETDTMKFEFTRANLQEEAIQATVTIKRKEKKHAH